MQATMWRVIRALYEMAQNCDFKGKVERIRDRLVIGLADKDLSEKVQLQSDLTLDDAVQMARQSELVRSQVKTQGKAELVRSQIKTQGKAEDAIEEVKNH